MKAVGNNLVIKTEPIKNKETETGLLLSVQDQEDNRYNLATGSVTIVAKAGIAVTGSGLAIGTTQPNIRLWKKYLL